jgi:hypothetical protein
MNRMKKILIVWFAVCFVCGFVFVFSPAKGGLFGQKPMKPAEPPPTPSASTSTETLKFLIEEGKWDELPAFFSDDSYKTLEDYFSAVKSIKIITSQLNNLTYKAKFTHQGEIGVITFREKEGKYAGVKIRNQIRPLYFIEGFKKYKAAGVRINLGDARLHFISGYFYETAPFDWLILFKGKWDFYIKPDDREERLTLIRNFKRDYFSKRNKTGIFILTQKDFLNRLKPVGEVTSLDKDLQTLYYMYRKAYGIEIKQFDEYWYLPFPMGTNLVAFQEDKKSFYYYSYNQDLVPDTHLALSEGNRLILNYNLHKGMKLSFTPRERIAEVQLNIFLNPLKNFISGTTIISYKEPSMLRVLQLAPGLKLVGNLDLDSKGLNVFRKDDKYYLMGSESDSLSLYYNGNIKPESGTLEILKLQDDYEAKDEGEGDLFYFLSRTQNFYPNPGSDFYKTDISVTVPESFNCLVSGNLTEKKVENAAVFRFTSKASTGISLVTGNFKLAREVEAAPPLHFYIPNAFDFPKNLDISEIKEAVNFFTKTFGAIDLSVVNILLKQGKREGGVSNNGFIVVNFPAPQKRGVIGTGLYISPPIAKRDTLIFSPILLRERSEDHILHELAHQWWGGLISWNSYQDVWITEGLAHFSLLYFLEKTMPERRFNRIIKKLKRWVFRYSDAGPIIYGNRINLLEKNYEAYQSVVYNKSALMFFMLKDLIGEEEFIRRLRSVVDKFKYKSISSMQFIREFSGDNDMLLKFFRKWIYNRALPLVELSLLVDDKEYDRETFKKVVISINQLGEDDTDTDFIFPLKLRVTTQDDTSIESVIVKEREQRFVITRDSTIRTIDIEDSVSPVKEKKQSPPYRRDR